MRWLPVLLLCLLFGIAGTIWMIGGSDPGAPPVAADLDPVPADDGEAEVATSDPPAPDQGDVVDGEPVEAQAAGMADDVRTAAAPEGDQKDGPTVRVVRGSPPLPVEDAEVFYVTRAVADERQGRERVRHYDCPEAFGQRARTDANGLVVLPPARSPWLVSARAGDEFGHTTAGPAPRTATIVLLPDEELVVVAKDDDQRPLPAIPILLLQQVGTDEARQIWDGTTGADGRAVVGHFQLVRQQMQDGKAAEPKPESFAALAAVATAPPVLAAFAGRPAQRDPVQLFLPPLGGIELQLTDHTGTPLLSPAVVGATTEPVPNVQTPVRLPPTTVHQRGTKPVGPDPVLLPLFGLGQPMRVFARFEGDRRGTNLVVPGPEQAGGRVRRELPLGPHHVLLAGRVRLADGSPIGLANLPGSVWRDERDIARPIVHTIADGRFDLVMTGRKEASRFVLELRHETAPGPDQPARQFGARVALPNLREGQRIDLGDIALAELPPLVSGLVVDDRGEAIANADVRVQQEIPVDPNARPDRNREPWRDLPHLATRTGDDGSFVLWGPMPRGPLRVRADSDLHFADSQQFGAAGQQLRIRIVRNGILRGRVLLPEWLADGTATLTLRPFDEALRERDTRRVDLGRRAGGRFRVEPLRTGRYDALVMLRNLDEPLAVIPDVFVEPGEVQDGRLVELDLRQTLFRYRLRAVDPAGTPVALDGPILLRTQDKNGQAVEAGFRWRKGRAEVVLASALAELQFFGRGIQPHRLQLGPGDHDVFLQPLQPALLSLPGARALCGPTRRVRVSVILTEPTGLPESLSGTDQRSGERFSFPRWDLGKSSGAWLEATDTVEVPLMKSGKYEVILRVHATGSERSPQASLSLGTFDLVADALQPRTVTVPVDAGALQQLLTGLDARPPEGRPR